jgi:hypothetical protein
VSGLTPRDIAQLRHHIEFHRATCAYSCSLIERLLDGAAADSLRAGIIALLDSDAPAGELRRSLAELVWRTQVRDPARIDRMIRLLARVWKAAPDQRLGQLVTNLLEDGGEQSNVWLIEDDVAERKLRAAYEFGIFVAAQDIE